MRKVLVAAPFEDKHKARLESSVSGCEFEYTSIPAATEEQIASANIIVGNVPYKKIHASEKLELLQLNSAGCDGYIEPGVLSENTVLTNATGAFSKTVAQHAFAVTLALQKKLPWYRDNQLRHEWIDLGPVNSIADSVVAVIGMGDIGCCYAEMAKALGAYVIGVKRRPGDKPAFVDELYTTDELDEVLKRADVIFSILPNTKQTRYIYTDEKFDLMKPSAIFVNCGRGNAVSGEVLARALNEKKIAAASIDVTETEPLPADSPLWDTPNLLITPHVSGFFHIPDTLEKITDITIHNINALVNGGEFVNIVDFETGYKK